MNKTSFIALAALFTQTVFAAPLLHTSDFIINANRTNLVDFEPIGAGSDFSSSFTQDGIDVNQVNGRRNNIWTTCFTCWFANDTFSWYPNGGDNGWTEITKADDADFFNIGVDLGSGRRGLADTGFVEYELLQDGVSVLLGSIPAPATGDPDGYIGFSGGGFDVLRLRNTEVTGGNFGDSAQNTLAIDNIELSGPSPVPEPSTLALIAIGLAGVGFRRLTELSRR